VKTCITPRIHSEAAFATTWKVILLWCAVLLLFVATVPLISPAQMRQVQPNDSELIPEPAIPAILAAFDKYEVVGMPAAHGMKDLDDLILSLMRNPFLWRKVNDVVVECGNSLYQSVLDRYIAGEEVPFAEVRKVWRNTTQPMCGMSGFYEQFFPLVRAINQKLPPEKRLRVLAGDPPIDWKQTKTFQDVGKFLERDASIASVMEKQVLSKHRKALMLFGLFHLEHQSGLSAVSMYEKDYPNLTFVITDIGFFTTEPTAFATWPFPSLTFAKGTWLVDAFLYLGPQDLMLREQVPADIALDSDYRAELWRRQTLPGSPETATDILKDADQKNVNGAANPLLYRH
jgi:hypothetical protein